VASKIIRRPLGGISKYSTSIMLHLKDSNTTWWHLAWVGVWLGGKPKGRQKGWVGGEAPHENIFGFESHPGDLKPNNIPD